MKRLAQRRRAQARYYRTEKGGQTSGRYDGSRIRVRVGGVCSSYRVREENREELTERLATFRADQAKSYKEAAGGVSTAIPRA